MRTTRCASDLAARLSGLAAAGMVGSAASAVAAQSCEWGLVMEDRPSERRASGAVFDSDRGVMVLWGGRGDPVTPGLYFDELWEWDGSEWILAATGGPPAASSPQMSYDSDRGRTVVYGGKHAGRAGETWEWDGDSWQMTAAVVDGPGYRDNAAMAFDAGRGVSVMFGGTTIGSAVLNDTWEYDGGWTPAAATGSPSPRYSHSMAYDAARGEIVLFGGVGPGGSPDYGETWVYDGDGWTLASSDGPAPRRQASMAYDSQREVVVLYGGRDAAEVFGDTWEWNGDEWTLAAPAGDLGTRYWAAMAGGPGGVTLHGGSDLTPSAVLFDDTWTLECGGGSCAYADCDENQELDFFDFLCFQNAFAAGEPYADCDGSGRHDFFDFLCFQNEFAEGCP